MSRLLQMFALVALALAPAAMHGARAAPAHHETAAAADHCAGGGQSRDDRDRGRSADCAIACAAMPCATAGVAPDDVPRPAFAAAPSPFFAGTAPGADPPPPRPA